MLSRRGLLFTAAAGAAAAPPMTPKERVDRVLNGKEPDRTPFTHWHHFRIEKFPGERIAQATLDYHRRFRTDLVKVMSDYPYPRAKGKWYELKVEQNPFPQQIRALEMIRDGLAGQAHFVETIFVPWSHARKMSSEEEVARLKQESPQKLLDAIEAMAKSEANHAKRAIAAGASGIFLAVDDAIEGILTREEYLKFSAPFDRMILDAVPSAPLNALHLHGDKVHLDVFWKGWPASIINYSVHATGVPFATARKQFAGVLMGGIDETKFRKLTDAQVRQQFKDARAVCGTKFLLAGGCSVPDDSTDEELLRVAKVLGA